MTLQDFFAIVPKNWKFVPVKGKRPLRDRWETEDPLSRDEISQLYTHGETLKRKDGKSYKATYTGIGLRLGIVSGGLLGCDFDGLTANSKMAEIAGENELPTTVEITSGRTGRKLALFQIPAEYWDVIETRKIQTKPKTEDSEAEFLEFRWNKLQQVVFGQHPGTKQPYRFVEGRSPADVEVAIAPLWLIEFLLIDGDSEPELDEIQPQRLPQASASPVRQSWDDFEANFRLPCSTALPLEVCLAPSTRAAIAGNYAKGRNDTGIAIANDLIGLANYFDGIGQAYTGDPRKIFMDWAIAVGLDKDTPKRQPETIWRSAERRNPSPTLSIDKIEGCAKSWCWKQRIDSTDIKLKSSPPNSASMPDAGESENDDYGDCNNSDQPRQKKVSTVFLYEQVLNWYGDRLSYNEFISGVELDGQLIDPEDFRIEFILARNARANPKEDFYGVLKRVAKLNTYHPVKRYLEACTASSDDIFGRCVAECLRVEDPSGLYREYLIRTLIGAVARIFSPGCKVDTCLILHGDQGIFKSSFFRGLTSHDWFTDSLGDIQHKDALMILDRHWVIELPELETITTRKEDGIIKSFLSRSFDTYRKPWDRIPLPQPRRCIIVGSTNQDEFLKDSTGDRRFWIIPNLKNQIDLSWLEQHRNDLWGTAVAMYRNGTPWWLDREEIEILRAETNAAFRVQDPWEEPISQYLIGRQTISITELLENAVQVEKGARKRLDSCRVADCLRAIGWKNTLKKSNGRVYRTWINPD